MVDGNKIARVVCGISLYEPSSLSTVFWQESGPCGVVVSSCTCKYSLLAYSGPSFKPGRGQYFCPKPATSFFCPSTRPVIPISYPTLCLVRTTYRLTTTSPYSPWRVLSMGELPATVASIDLSTRFSPTRASHIPGGASAIRLESLSLPAKLTCRRSHTTSPINTL